MKISVCRHISVGLMLCLFCTACASALDSVQQQAASFGFKQRTVAGTKFLHRIYDNQKQTNKGVLHVYIEGDGLPWLNSDWVSPDPTPRDPLMLRLMAYDSESAIYLGRPCYFGFAEMDACDPWWWTVGRYSADVVDSMMAALGKLISEKDDASVVLIGHSGGGALAMLLAARPLNVNVVITLAGNLDTDAWSRLHHFRDLSGSLNPALMLPLDSRIRQLHFLGAADKNTPPTLVSRFASHQQHAYFEIFPDFDHRCCWEGKWPDLLKRISMSTASGPDTELQASHW
ncbi:MAG: alpha/beta fold hydrolase [Gammaproteobacteria bacterium]